MKNIIPAILTKDLKTAERLLKLFDIKNQWVQLDIMDGQFVSGESLALSDLNFIPLNCSLEVHLMVSNPADYFTDCQKLNAKKVWVHHESLADFNLVKRAADQAGLQLGIAVNPDTSIEVLHNYSNEICGAMLMAVHPGQQGQQFIPETLNRLTMAGEILPPNSCLAIDGGVNKDNFTLLKNSLATDIAIGSAIVASNNPLTELAYFKSQINIS